MAKTPIPQTQIQLQELIAADLKKRLDAYFKSNNVDPVKAEKFRQKLLKNAEPLSIRAARFAHYKPQPPVILNIKDILPGTYLNG